MDTASVKALLDTEATANGVAGSTGNHLLPLAGRPGRHLLPLNYSADFA